MTDRPPAPKLSDERRAAMRSVLLEHARETERAPRRRRWRLPVLIPVFVIAIAGGAGAAAGLFSGELEDPTGVACYRAADLNVAHEYVNVSWEADEARAQREATELCAPYWERGAFGDGERVPPLIACVHQGRTVVFPGGRGTCAKLGLKAIAAETFRSQARQRRAFQQAFSDLGLGTCSRPPAVREKALAIIERTGMTGWTVRVEGDQRCVAFVEGDFGKREIRIIGDPDHEFVTMGGFIVSATITDAEEITREEFEQHARENERRACSEEATSVISNILSCRMAKADGTRCVSVQVTRTAITPFLEEELGPGARVVIDGEGDCLTGFEFRDPEGEVVLSAAERP